MALFPEKAQTLQSNYMVSHGSLLKCLSVMLLLVITATGLFAAEPSLMTYALDEPVYRWIDTLYTLEGKAVPNQAKPWSEIDVSHMLDRVDPTSEIAKDLWRKIEGTIKKKKGDFSGYVDVYFSPEFLIHSNPAEFNTYDRIAGNPANLTSPFFGFYLYGAYKEYMAMLVDIELNIAQAYGEPFPKLNPETGFYDPNFTMPSYSQYEWYMGSNIIYLPNKTFEALLYFPDRTYFITGFDAMRVSLARDRIKWGSGNLGNMLLGDTLPWHDYFSIDFTGSNWFNYTFLVDFFTYESNFEYWDKVGAEHTIGAERFRLKGSRYLIAHRFAFSFFDSRFNFAINDSVMYASPDSTFNFTAFLPLFFLHDIYIFGNSNSLLTLEFEYAPIKGLSLYVEGAIDDIAMPNEPNMDTLEGKERHATVPGWAIAAGARGALPYHRGIFNLGGEFVYTSPYVWHRGSCEYDRETGEIIPETYDENLYFVSSLRYIFEKPNSRGIFQYLSYPFGSDAIAGILTFGYEVPGLWDASFDAFFMAHGIISKFSLIEYATPVSGNSENTPSTTNPFHQNESGVVEYTFVIGGRGDYSPLSWLKVGSSLYLFGVINNHNKSSACKADVQLGLSITMSY